MKWKKGKTADPYKTHKKDFYEFYSAIFTIYAPQMSNSASLSKKSHPSSKSAWWSALVPSSSGLFLGDRLSTEGVGLVLFGVSDDFPCLVTKTGASLLRDEPEEAKLCSETISDAMLFTDEPEEARVPSGTRPDTMLFTDVPEAAKMQLVWLEETDLLNGTRSSNFSFSRLTSWQITEISPLHNDKMTRTLHKLNPSKVNKNNDIHMYTCSNGTEPGKINYRITSTFFIFYVGFT